MILYSSSIIRWKEPAINFRVFFFFILICSVQPVFLQAQQMDSSSLPVVWLRADKSEFTNTSWSDYSGNRYNATALKGEGPAKNSLFNFNPALSFDGNNYMKIPYSVDGL